MYCNSAGIQSLDIHVYNQKIIEWLTKLDHNMQMNMTFHDYLPFLILEIKRTLTLPMLRLLSP